MANLTGFPANTVVATSGTEVELASGYTDLTATNIAATNVDATDVDSTNARVTTVFNNETVSAKTTSDTLTTAEVLGGIITANQGASAAATYTTPTGTEIEAAITQFDLANGDSFDLCIVNISTDAAEDVTLAGGDDVTIVGNAVVASNAAATDQSSGIFRFVRTAANTWSAYRIA